MSTDPNPPPGAGWTAEEQAAWRLETEADGPAIAPQLPAPAPAGQFAGQFDPGSASAEGIDLVGLALAGLKASSQAGYRKDLRAFVRWGWGGWGERATPDAALRAFLRLSAGQANGVILAWAACMQAAKLSPATVRRRVAAVRKVVKRARLIGLTTVQLDVDLPRAEAFRDTAGPGRKGWRAILARAQSEAEAARTPTRRARSARNLAVLLLLHDRALRRSEVAGLDLADFDPAQPAVAVVGKGKSARRWLTISTRAAEAVRAWIGCRGPGPADGPLFLHLHNAAARRGPGRLSDWAINELVKAVARRAGLSRAATAHALRHQAITEALDRCRGNVRDVRIFSRHERIDTVMIYDDRRRDVGGAISEALGSGSRPRNPAAVPRKLPLPGDDDA